MDDDDLYANTQSQDILKTTNIQSNYFTPAPAETHEVRQVPAKKSM